MSISGYGTWTVTWPWPQAFFTQYYLLAASEEDWGTVTGAGAEGHDSLVLFELYNESNTWNAQGVGRLGLPAEILSVDVAPFGRFYVVAVRKTGAPHQLFIRNPNSDSDTDAIVQTDDATVPRGITVCNYKGQCIIGGLESNNPPWDSLGNCSVAWSGIGRFTFDPEEDKTAGFITMPWDDWGKGLVYKVLRLGDLVAVYGDSGIAVLNPYSNKLVTGLGLGKDEGMGIPHTYCIAGNQNVQLFLDNNLDLSIVDKGFNVNKLGYRSYMENLTLADIRMSYVPQERKFYICDNSYSYILTEYGLYSCHQSSTGLGSYRGTVCGFLSSRADYEARVTIDEEDFEVRALKTLDVIEFGVDYSLGSDLAVNGSFASDEYWTKEAGWTISGGTANCDASANSEVKSLIQTTEELTEDSVYIVSYELSNYSAGEVMVSCGADGNGTYRSKNGTFVEVIQCSGDGYLQFGAGVGFIGSIDNVTVEEVNLIYGGVDFKYSFNEPYRSSSWIRINDEGLVFPIITGNDFRLKFKAVDYRISGLRLDYLQARFKVVDKRGIRGPYAYHENLTRRG